MCIYIYIGEFLFYLIQRKQTVFRATWPETRGARWIHSLASRNFSLAPDSKFHGAMQCSKRRSSDYSPLSATITLCYSVCTRADRDYIVFSFICWFILRKPRCSSRSRNERWSEKELLRSRRNRGKERNSYRIVSLRYLFFPWKGRDRKIGGTILWESLVFGKYRNLCKQV